jgi:peptidoglycan/LPS O-acetylase OafA/YrhL
MHKSGRIPGLDGVRALSIILVLFAHVANGVTSLAPYAAFGVSIFFVLSGFLITRLLCLEEDREREISLPSFYLRRSLRILPPAILFIATVSALASFGWARVSDHEVLYSVLFLRNILATNEVTHLSNLWSLAIEEQFYLLWPLVFLLLRTNRKRLVFATVLYLACPFWAHLIFRLAGGADRVNGWRFDLRYDALMAGAALALLWHDCKFQCLVQNRFFRSGYAPALGVLGMIAGCYGLPRPIQAFSTTLSFISVALFINFAVQVPDGKLGRVLNWTPVVWIGQLSYSLYLWQQPFCWHSSLSVVGHFPLNVVTSLILAALSFYLLEAPLAAIRKRVPYIRNPRWTRALEPSVATAG